MWAHLRAPHSDALSRAPSRSRAREPDGDDAWVAVRCAVGGRARVSRARRASCPRVCARGVDTLVDSRVARRVDGSRAAVVARARARVVIARASASRLAPQQTHIDGVDAYVSRMADFVPPSAARRR